MSLHIIFIFLGDHFLFLKFTYIQKNNKWNGKGIIKKLKGYNSKLVNYEIFKKYMTQKSKPINSGLAI